MTSDGTCRFVMPLSEFVYDRRGPRSRSAVMAAAISVAPLDVVEPGEDRAEAVVRR